MTNVLCIYCINIHLYVDNIFYYILYNILHVLYIKDTSYRYIPSSFRYTLMTLGCSLMHKADLL